MPVLPLSLIEPAWVEFSHLLGVGDSPEFSPSHPWGCHRRRVSDRVVFELVLAARARLGLRTDRDPGVFGPHHQAPCS